MNDERTKKDINYGTKTAVQTENGIIEYDPESMKGIVGGEKLTYDEYLESDQMAKLREVYTADLSGDDEADASEEEEGPDSAAAGAETVSEG